MNEQEAVRSYSTEVKSINEKAKNYPAEVKKVIHKEIDRAASKSKVDQLPLKVGDKAPDFKLKNALGKEIHLSDLLQKKKVVLTIYRGTWCPYCNLQLTQFQEVVFKL